MFWLIVLLLIALAFVGGIVVSKLIFLLLLVALVIALVGMFGRTA